MDALLLAHLVITAFLCGLIWTVQLVHYPLFPHSAGPRFAAFEAEHQRRISWVVVPAMLAEAGTAVGLFASAWRQPEGIPLVAAGLNLTLLAAIWAATAWLAVPQHARLAHGFDEAAWRRLVTTNWVRTAAWSARLLLLLGLMVAGG